MYRGMQLGVSQKWLDMTEEDIAQVKSWGFSITEIHQCRLDQLMHPNGDVNQEWIEDNLDPIVGWCETAELNHIVNTKALCGKNTNNLWWVPPIFWRSAGYSSRPSGGEAMADISHKFWNPSNSGMNQARIKHKELIVFLANRYKDNIYTMLGINNEPMHHTTKFQSDLMSEVLGAGYTTIMSDEVNAVRDAGFSNTVMVDRPYTKIMEHFLGLDAEAWIEIHQYVSKFTKDFEGWRARIDTKIDFYRSLGLEVYIGEEGVDPPPFRHELDDWLDTQDRQTKHLENAPIKGYSWHGKGKLQEYAPDEQALIDTISQFCFEPEPPTTSGWATISIPTLEGKHLKFKVPITDLELSDIS